MRMRVRTEVCAHHETGRDSGAGQDAPRSARRQVPEDGMSPMTSTRRFDVTAIGNAIVDVLARADDALLIAHNLQKGAMTLIDAADAERLYGIMGPGREISGGSAANTAAAIAALGGRCAYIGKVAADQLGHVFTHDIRAAGVTYETAPLVDGLSTARCLIFVT